jgi:hypothetical protein
MRRDPSLTPSAFYDNGAMLTVVEVVVEVKIFKSLKPLKSKSLKSLKSKSLKALKSNSF